LTTTQNPITAALQAQPAGRTLDLATGTGGFLDYLTNVMDDVAFGLGVDPSYAALTKAREAGIVKSLAQMQSGALGLASATFDTVGISNALHHLDDFVDTFMEISRVLRSGGRLIFEEVYRDHQSPPQETDIALHHWVAEIDRARGKSHNETYSRDELLVLVSALDLHDVQTFDFAELEADPLDPDKIARLDRAIRRIAKTTRDLDNGPVLQAKAENLRDRVRTVGHQPARRLMVIGTR
jgi:SAM-dependent methyltransferase